MERKKMILMTTKTITSMVYSSFLDLILFVVCISDRICSVSRLLSDRIFVSLFITASQGLLVMRCITFLWTYNDKEFGLCCCV